MAKKKTQRERPTLAKLRELRATIDTLQRQVSTLTSQLTDVQAIDAQNLKGAVSQADAMSEAQGLLHTIMDELGPGFDSAVANKIRRFLGRPELPPKSRIQRLLEAHARGNNQAQPAESLALGN